MQFPVIVCIIARNQTDYLTKLFEGFDPQRLPDFGTARSH